LAGATVVSLTLLVYTLLLWTWGMDRFVIMFLGLSLMAGGVTVYVYRLCFLDQGSRVSSEHCHQEVARASESGSIRT